MRFKYGLVLLSKIYISIALIALLVLPYAFTLKFTGVEDNADWGYLFVWEDELLILMFAPFLLLWGWYLLSKKSWQILILLFLSFFYMGNSMGSIVMSIPDFAPSAGVILAGSLFPCLVLLYFLTRKKKTAMPLQQN